MPPENQEAFLLPIADILKWLYNERQTFNF